jgi:branched-chain amino acid transport system substrate-binding protein
LRIADCGLNQTRGAHPQSAIANPQSHDTRRPFFDARAREPNYAGPGREQADPPDVAEVLIGYFGPPVAAHPQAGDMWCAASLAVEQANAEGGYRNKPFRLVPAWSDSPWGAGVKELTRLVFEDRVWAVVGGIDGPTTHLAEQVTVKAGLPLLNPVSTDKTVNLINVPWIFSCTPQDHIQAQVLAEGLVARLGAGSSDCGWRMADCGLKDRADPNPHSHFVLVSAVDHDSHLFAVELQKAVTARPLTWAYSYQFNPSDRDVNDLVEKVCSAGSDAVVIIADASTSAQFVRRVRAGGYSGSIWGGPWMGQRTFFTEAGRGAEGIVFPCAYAAAPELSAFAEEFTRRFGRSPDYLAAHTYDAVNLLVAAVRRSGLNRARIRDALRALSPWPGVSGTITWDSPGRNRRPVNLCTLREGRVVPLAPEQQHRAARVREASR